MQVIENLREIIYEPVTDEYGWGKYGEFRVLIRRRDGYVNASKLCKDGGKFLANWNENKSSLTLKKEVSESLGIPIHRLLENVTDESNLLKGTYVHQDLIPHIASWISPKFAVKVSRIVNNWVVQEYRETIRKNKDTISSLEKELKEFREETRQRDEESRQREDALREEMARRDLEAKKFREEANAKLDLANENIIEAVGGIHRANTSIDGLHTTLSETCEMHVPPAHLQRKDTETYALYYCGKKNGDIVYTQCRARPYHLRRREAELRTKCRAAFRVVLKIHPIANARSQASEFERRIEARGAVFSLKYQMITLPQGIDLTEEEMVSIAREVFRERRSPARTAEEKFPGLSVELEEEKGPAEEVRIKVETQARKETPQEEEEKGDGAEEQFRELMSKTLEELKAIARAFPRDLKTYGGWSGKTKPQLCEWIIARRAT